MSSNVRSPAALARSSIAPGSALAFALLVGGCSADVTRFEFPAFAFNEKGSETGSLPPERMARNPRYDDAPAGAPRGAGLSDAGRSYNSPSPSYAPNSYTPAANAPPTYSPPPAYSPPAYSPPPAYSSPAPQTDGRVASARDYVPPPAAEPAPGTDRYAGRPMERARAAARGETIQVQQGDTLYGIARRYGVSVAALIEINGLAHGSSIKPGQQLVLPASGSAKIAADPPAGRAPATRAAIAPAAPAATAGWEGRYTLRSGQSLYSVARQHGVTLAELQRVNGITEPTRVRAGTVLSVPTKAEPAPVAESAAPATSPPSTREAAPAQPRILNAPQGQRTAALNDRSTDAAPAPATPASAAQEPAASSSRFRWPARGRVIAPFGKRDDGTHNDGVNIALPQGTDIHAAEGGRVAYAGNELKGYGNLVLIRHDNGWVSAYAHADQILVKRDDVVKRGQVIAKAGKTGTVDQPQLHFELRQGAKPVDPLPHMER
jgi:murein DD-endopeptidase MepM/ murein hydrolase activator NlpD